MKISKKDLVKQLSEQLGSDEEAVSSQFDKMLADIQKALSKGESFCINGFGTFTVTNNEITFEIAPSFAAEINYTYEGMLPIDVDGTAAFSQDNEKAKPAKPSRSTPVVIVDQGVDGEEDPFVIPNSKEESSSISEISESINDTSDETDLESMQLVQQEPEDVASEPVNSTDPFNKERLSEQPSDEVEAPVLVSENSAKNDTVLDAFFVEEPPMELEGVLHDSDQDIDRLISDGVDPQQNAHGPRVVSIEEDAKDNSISFGSILRWVAILLLIVFNAGSVYWYFTGPGQNLFRSSQPLAVKSSQPVVIPSDEAVVSVDVPKTEDYLSENTANQLTDGVSEDNSIVSNETESAATENSTIGAISSQNDPPGTNVNPDPEPAATTSVNLPTQSGSITPHNASYGLNGVEQILSGRVFSIIVHSLPSQISAHEQCNEISALNLRCLVREATGPQGRTTYRVGIGQFESLQVAESAVSQLPEPYRSRNFVARVN